MPNQIPQKPTKKHGFTHLFFAAKYTIYGLRSILKETAFQHELLLGIFILPAAWFMPFSTAEALFLTLLWTLLLIIEMLNTAIEAVVDLVSPDYHILAKKAKDLGSSAVGIMILFNILSWIILLLDLFL
ncbi:MAG: diacylglycerol kinase [Lentisphaeria bacterium]